MGMFYSYVRNYGDLHTRFGKIQNYDQDLKMVIFYSYVKLPEGNNPRSGYLVGGWDLPLWKNGVKVSWGYDIPNWMESHKIHVPNHQPVIINHY